MKILFYCLLLALLGFSPVSASCDFNTWITYNGTSLLRHVTSTAYAYTSKHVGIDADGSPNAYHPDDIGLHCTKGKGFKGLDCPANAGYPNTTWWTSVLLQDPDNKKKAYTQKSGEFKGYFLSKTSLSDKGKSATDPSKYVNASSIPYIVFPGNFYRMKETGLMGDIGYAVNLSTGNASPFVVADVGPAKADLGEISIAIASALGGNNPNARTGEGKPSGNILYIVFPYSSKTYPWPLSNDEIDDISNQLLSGVGGIAKVKECFK